MAGAQPESGRDEAFAQAGPGTAVEVRSRFDGRWCRGFEVAEVVVTPAGTAVRVRRCSDGTVLPTMFPAAEVFVVR